MHRPAATSTTVGASLLPDLLVVPITAALVAMFDAVLSARVRAGTDHALRLSVLLPYLGIGSRYVLARALGLSALVLAGGTVALGLERGRRRAEGLATSELMGRVHRQISLVAIVLVAAHAALPFTSSVTPYGGWTTVLVPFDQPFSWGESAATFESLGIIAFFLMVLLGPTYYLLRRRRLWVALHAITVAAYGLSVLHALFLGSDFIVRGPARVALIALQVPITVLLARRLRAPSGGARSPVRRGGTAVAVVASAGVALLAIGGVAGAPLGGFPL